jgi:hypothetical protein
MVDAISMFRMRYVVEVPDECRDPIPYAKDSVTCEDTREYSQEHLDEVISSCREVTLEEAIEQFRMDNSNDVWDEETIIKNSFTEMGFERKTYEDEEEKRWRMSTN